MREEYKAFRTSDGLAWIKSSKLGALQEVDAVVFDCDGVLVDTRKSYDAAITEVTDRLLRLIGVRLPWKKIAPSLILRLRRTGGFNSDWDSVYALVLFSILALSESQAHKIGEGGWRKLEDEPKSVVPSRDVGETMARVVALTKNFCSKDGILGHESVNRFLQQEASSPAILATVTRVRKWLGYPGSPPASLLSTIFDEMYHGARLFRRAYGIVPRYYRGRGLVENERILVRRSDLEALTQLVGRGRLALVTGRPYLATKYVLRDMMSYFNRNVSLFIGDMGEQQFARFRKPSGLSLIHTRQTLSSDMLLYAGDSAEDVKMAEEARGAKEPVLFSGIYGTSLHPEEQLRFFKRCGSDLILPTARQIPVILAMTKS